MAANNNKQFSRMHVREFSINGRANVNAINLSIQFNSIVKEKEMFLTLRSYIKSGLIDEMLGNALP
jgi:hypothetical protein